MRSRLFRAAFWSAALVAGTGVAYASVPPQVVPVNNEIGTPTFTPVSEASSSNSSSSSSSSSTSSSSAYDGAYGTTSAYETLLNESYGAAAVEAAQSTGINPDTLAAFAQIESNFQNVGNSTSSAEGVWQITDATWNEYASQLGLTDADRNDPASEAAVASAIIGDYADAVSAATGTAATGTQVYGAYMFGTKAGSEIATETDPSTPLSTFVSSSALAANNMTGWTVGQYEATVASRMGSGASETVNG